jgi:hypothetical protein
LERGFEEMASKLFGKKKCEDNKGDFNIVPEEIQRKIRKVIVKKLFPAILEHMKANEYRKIRGIPIEHIPYKLLCSYRGSLLPAFPREEQYNLYLLKRYFCWKKNKFYNIDGKILVGAAIRTSNFIGKQELKDELEEIVRDCFIPDKDPPRNALVPHHCC